MERNERLDNFAIVSGDIDESVTVLLEVMTWTIFQKTETRFLCVVVESTDSCVIDGAIASSLRTAPISFAFQNHHPRQPNGRFRYTRSPSTPQKQTV